VGSYDDGATAITGFMDEIAFYPTALNAAKILAHYNAASSLVPGAYNALVLADGATMHLDQNPPAVSIAKNGATPTVTFTGILSESTDLLAPFWTASWPDLGVTSPHALTGTLTGERYFRSHR
jgi:hypothetical protein